MNANTSGTSDRRRRPRFDLMAQVHVKRGRTALVMELSNISTTGALVHMGTLKRPGWIAIDRDVGLAITNPLDFEQVELTGRVARIVEDRSGICIGIEFGALDDEQKRGVAELVQTAQSSPPPPRRQPPPLPSSR